MLGANNGRGFGPSFFVCNHSLTLTNYPKSLTIKVEIVLARISESAHT